MLYYFAVCLKIKEGAPSPTRKKKSLFEHAETCIGQCLGFYLSILMLISFVLVCKMLVQVKYNQLQKYMMLDEVRRQNDLLHSNDKGMQFTCMTDHF